MNLYIVTGCFIVFDVATGLLKAFHSGKVDSTILREGLYHKIAEIMTLVGCNLVEFTSATLQVEIPFPVIGFIAGYISIMEFTSCLENLAEVNPFLAKLFKPYLAKIKAIVDDETQDTEKF